VSVLYPHNRQLSARVRVFADWLSGIFHEAASTTLA
jgi:LysR family transcriptional regulator, regulator for bpeEF and oprC